MEVSDNLVKVVQKIKHDTASFILWCLLSIVSLCVYAFINHVELTRFLIILCFFTSLLVVWSYIYSCMQQILKLIERKK